ncbi:uncharacterized protein HKW66_Vig0017120 [Vigna angularis]|uniref:Uncharacterized protein n=1 Tax=Phaseolus angularis TaxID=3914 RepID=A0A8T0LG54_PHAAN|nr:uncharacterized protein HKW66_Vig0017120 [Vigna angularis]
MALQSSRSHHECITRHSSLTLAFVFVFYLGMLFFCNDHPLGCEQRRMRELVQKLTGICRSDLDDDTAIGDADAFKPATPPLKRELKGESEENEATASVSTDEEDGCNMSEVISNYNNFSILESDFLNGSSNTPLLHFADLYGSL